MDVYTLLLKVGLQRETTPQPEVKPSTPQVEEGEEVVEVEVTEEPSRVSTSTAGECFA